MEISYDQIKNIASHNKGSHFIRAATYCKGRTSGRRRRSVAHRALRSLAVAAHGYSSAPRRCNPHHGADGLHEQEDGPCPPGHHSAGLQDEN